MLVMRPAAIVTPPTLNIIRPNSLHSLNNSSAMGRVTCISTNALVLLPKNLGRFLIISPVLLFNCDINLVTMAGSTND